MSPSKISQTSNHAVQIIEHLSKNRFKVDESSVKKIYGNERIADFPLVVLCIAGAARKGKSFLLNFFLDYLIHKEQNPDKEWTLNDKTKLAGFEFREGEDRTTMGIWAWSHIFVIEQNNGKKVAVSLIDSQGTFDNKTSYQDCSTIFAMTCLFSSVMCFNVFTDLQEDKLNDLTAFVEHGKKIVENLGGNGKLFQDLSFIIRDFNHVSYLKQKNGGQKYIEKILNNVDDDELQAKRDILNASYERVFGFIFPYPGKKVAQDRTSNISEMETDFVTNVKSMVEKLLSPDRFQVKKLGLSEMRSKDMSKYILECMESFENNKQFAPQAVQVVNQKFMINLEAEKAIEKYVQSMDKNFHNRRIGYSNAELFKIHENMMMDIKKPIVDNIKDKNIATKILEKITFDGNKHLQNYTEKNNFLVENEKKRQQMIENERRYREQLVREKAEANAKLEEEKRENEKKQAEIRAQKERERIQLEREHAAKMEKERIAHEKKQAKLVRKQEEERKRLEAEMTSKLEAEKKESEKREREIRAENERERRALETSRSSSQMSDQLMAQLFQLQLSSAAANSNRYDPGYSNGYCNNGMYNSGPGYGNGYGGINMYGGGSSSYGNSSRSSSSGNPASGVYYDKNVGRYRDSKGRFAKDPNK